MKGFSSGNLTTRVIFVLIHAATIYFPMLTADMGASTIQKMTDDNTLPAMQGKNTFLQQSLCLWSQCE